MRGVIAELGNHHLGDVEKAKEMIRIAKECGAHYAKMQVIDPLRVSKHGSMTLGFYEQCALTAEEYAECQEYGLELGIEVFFSVFADIADFRDLDYHYYKISGSQFLAWTREMLMGWNHPKTIISIPQVDKLLLKFKAPAISRMTPMFVTPYMKDHSELVNFATLVSHQNILNRPVGYSDHSLGIANCLVALNEYDAPLIEKHMNPFGPQSYDGRVYRDCYHAATPKHFEMLCKAYREYHREC